MSWVLAPNGDVACCSRRTCPCGFWFRPLAAGGGSRAVAGEGSAPAAPAAAGEEEDHARRRRAAQGVRSLPFAQPCSEAAPTNRSGGGLLMLRFVLSVMG